MNFTREEIDQLKGYIDNHLAALASSSFGPILYLDKKALEKFESERLRLETLKVKLEMLFRRSG